MYISFLLYSNFFWPVASRLRDGPWNAQHRALCAAANNILRLVRYSGASSREKVSRQHRPNFAGWAIKYIYIRRPTDLPEEINLRTDRLVIKILGRSMRGGKHALLPPDDRRVESESRPAITKHY